MATKRKVRKKTCDDSTGSTGSTGAVAKRASGEEAAAPRKRATASRWRWPVRIGLIVLGLLLVVAAAFSWDRWLRYDDARELQGEWQVDGTARVVVVDGESIKLTDDVAYAYEIDPRAKTISFTFGDMAGSGRYRFSADRAQLVVMEGSDYSAWSTLWDDIAWMWDGFVRSVQGQPPAEPQAGDGTTVLVRVSHDAAAAPRDDPALAEKAAAEEAAKAQAEAAAAAAAQAAEAEKNAAADGGQDAPAPEPPAQEPPADEGAATSPGDLFDVSDLPA